MHTSAETTTWFRRCNLSDGRSQAANELPREVEIYLLVTFAVRPEVLPEDVVSYLATRFFGHCAGGAAAA